MFSTLVFAVVYIVLPILSVILWALLLRLGLRWVKAPGVTRGRLILATVIVYVLGLGLNLWFSLEAPGMKADPRFLALAGIAASVIVPCLVIGGIFKIRFLRALRAWLPTLLVTVATTAFSLLVLRPFLFVACTVPTNAMAPTLLGKHRQGVCPECGQPDYGSPIDNRPAHSVPPPMICDNFHVTQASHVDRRVYDSDYFLAAKFLSPRRWDVIVFQSPEDPATMLVKRLVGLPGEKIFIEDGAVWVDGKRQTLPDSIRGIEYVSQFPELRKLEVWGSAERPALLGDDEYFVLGDFSSRSLDSRLWKRGAPGHKPFAVPESHLKGVVTHTYWPPRRWRIHR